MGSPRKYLTRTAKSHSCKDHTHTHRRLVKHWPSESPLGIDMIELTVCDLSKRTGVAYSLPLWRAKTKSSVHSASVNKLSPGKYKKLCPVVKTVPFKTNRGTYNTHSFQQMEVRFSNIQSRPMAFSEKSLSLVGIAELPNFL